MSEQILDTRAARNAPRWMAVMIVLVSMLPGLARADVEIVAETGAQAPGEAVGVTFSRFTRAPVIGGNGHVVFSGWLSGPGITNASNEVIFAGIPRFLHKVAQEGQAAPGTDPGVSFFSLPSGLAGNDNRLIVSDSGDVAFLARIAGTGVNAFNQYGVWAEIDGVLTFVARNGQALPGGSTLTAIQDFAFTDASVVLFVSVDPGSTAILVYRGGTLSFVVAAGDPAPGFVDCTLSGLFRPVSSPSGKIAFRANLLADVGGAICPITMYVEDGGAFIPALSSGDLTPPGLPTGTVFGNFSAGANILLPKINEHGDLIVHGPLIVPNEPGVSVSAWIVRENGNLELLAIEGETMPSDPSVEIDALSAEGVNNSTGRSALRATLSTGTAILVGDPRTNYDYAPLSEIGPTGLAEVARFGEQAADGMAGWTYSSLDDPFINNSGHVAFNGGLSIGGNCLWIGPPGGLSLVLCTGQPVDVIDPAVGLRVETPNAFLPLTNVPAVDGSGSGDGLANPFSDTGQVVSRVSFSTSATTAIVISPPEPVDTDSDGIEDYLEGGGDVDDDDVPNFEDTDSDGDGIDDELDNCPLVANPGQGAAPFGQTVLAANKARFEWPVAISFVAARGSFVTSSDVGTFTVDDTHTGFGRDLPTSEPLAAGSGFWYLLRPDCAAGAWVSGGNGELPGRDSSLP